MAEFAYLPRGGGFEVRLAARHHEIVVRGMGPDDAHPEVVGSPELSDNVALVALMLGCAANELGYRRSRSPEKRAGHREAADVQRKDALALADLAVRQDERTIEAWCSGCFSKTMHRHVQGSDRPKRDLPVPRLRHTDECNCGVLGCSHRAVIRPRARVRFSYCAEHRHAIPAFEKLDATIPSLSDYRDFLKHEVRNAERIAKVTGGTIGAAVVVAPLRVLLLPRAVGAALGSSVFGGSLTGAAATSHGLAMSWPRGAGLRRPRHGWGHRRGDRHRNGAWRSAGRGHRVVVHRR